MGGPFEGKYRNASVLHDVAYDQKNKPPPEVDRMFYNAMRCSGVGPVEAKTMYYALLRFGRHWKFSVKKAKPVLPDSSRDFNAAQLSLAAKPFDRSANERVLTCRPGIHERHVDVPQNESAFRHKRSAHARRDSIFGNRNFWL